MSQDMKDFVLVTGASSGIGAIYVDRLPSTAMQTTPITQRTLLWPRRMKASKITTKRSSNSLSGQLGLCGK